MVQQKMAGMMRAMIGNNKKSTNVKGMTVKPQYNGPDPSDGDEDGEEEVPNEAIEAPMPK